MTKKTDKPKTGRPPKYKKDFCEQMVAFFTCEAYEKVEVERHEIQTKYGTNTHIKYKLVPNKLPFFEAFARKIGVAYSTLQKWATVTKGKKDTRPRYPEFAEAYNKCKQLQKEQLIHAGIVGAIPPATYIFTAKNITDMVDKQLVDDTIREVRVTDGTDEGGADAAAK